MRQPSPLSPQPVPSRKGKAAARGGGRSRTPSAPSRRAAAWDGCPPSSGRATGVLVAALLLAAGGARAEVPEGCFIRDYSAEHLAKNPNQHVATLRLRFYRAEDGTDWVAVTGRFTDRGRARLDDVEDAAFNQGAFCLDRGRSVRCQVECDAGNFDIRALRGDTLEIETRGFTLDLRDADGSMEEGCGGYSDLAELGSAKTIYRLTRAPISACTSKE